MWQVLMGGVISLNFDAPFWKFLFLFLVFIAICLCCHLSCLACLMLVLLVLLQLLVLCCVLLSKCVTTCCVCVFCPSVLPFLPIIPKCGNSFLFLPLVRPWLSGRFACCSMWSTLPETAGGLWALEFFPLSSSGLKGWVPPEAYSPCRTSSPPGLMGGGSASAKVGGTLLSSILSSLM